MVQTRRKPDWLKKRSGLRKSTDHVRSVLSDAKLKTVCSSARCPNLGECFSSGTATFMILGAVCTRSCRFCSVDGGSPASVDPDEAIRVAKAARTLKISHVVITSVTRDDLPDGGAAQFAATINSVRKNLPESSVEVLTPDFNGDIPSIDKVIIANPEVFNHNVETVPRLYSTVRPQAIYKRSLDVLRHVKNRDPSMTVKSGIMVGLGETLCEIRETLTDLKNVGCDIVTVGQYLQPSKKNLPVTEYIRPEVFDEIKRVGEEEIGLSKVFAGPYVRSSYKAQTLAFDSVAGGVFKLR